MRVHVHESEVLGPRPEGGKKIIGEGQGCLAGFCMGISWYTDEAYGKPGIHEDQEGFYILEGEGFAKVGEEEFAIRPGSFFVALKGVPHSIRVARGEGPVKVLWAHGAV